MKILDMLLNVPEYFVEEEDLATFLHNAIVKEYPVEEKEKA